MTWIYAIPTWLFMSACTIGSCILSVLLLAFTRSRITRNEQITHNDVAGPILATIGTVLAVMMSFMVVGVWQEWDNSAQNVQDEASALSDLHHIADAFPTAERRKIQGLVDRYITIVLTDEWPLMRRGEESIAAHNVGYDIERAVDNYTAKSSQQNLVQGKAIDLTGRFLDARRQRIHDNETGIPLILWATMLFTGIVTVLFSFYFRVDRPGAQYIMVVALAAVISSIFSLIAELDYPFRGDISITPQAFVHVYNTVHNIGLR